MSKYVALVRFLPEKVALKEPPTRTLAASNTRPVASGITVAGLELVQGAFIEVTQRLFSKVLAPIADRLRISKPDAAFSGTLFDTSIGGLPATTFPRRTLRIDTALMRIPVTFPVTMFSSIKLSVPFTRPSPKLIAAALE